jgi:hypothetical protein
MARKYRFPDRRTAEAEVTRLEQELTLHRISLDCLLRDEVTWTKRFTAPSGAWFQMGIARASAAHGGLVLSREYYPSNCKPSQNAHWADTWIRNMSEHFSTFVGSDAETRTFYECFLALRAIYNQATKAA